MDVQLRDPTLPQPASPGLIRDVCSGCLEDTFLRIVKRSAKSIRAACPWCEHVNYRVKGLALSEIVGKPFNTNRQVDAATLRQAEQYACRIEAGAYAEELNRELRLSCEEGARLWRIARRTQPKPHHTRDESHRAKRRKRNQLIISRYQHNESCQSIADSLGVTVSVVQHVLRKSGARPITPRTERRERQQQIAADARALIGQGYSQRQCAGLLGVGQSSISRALNGRAR